MVLFLILGVGNSDIKLLATQRENAIILLPFEFAAAIIRIATIEIVTAATFYTSNEFGNRELGWNGDNQMDMVINATNCMKVRA